MTDPVPTLVHVASDPTSFEQLTVETADDHTGPWQPNWPAGTERRVLGRDPVSGGSLTLLRFPAGYDRLDEAQLHAEGRPQRFEYHSCHEEIVSLEGDYGFGVPELYRFDARSYLNHPPYWLHPARQRSVAGVLLLVRNSHPVDFGFCDVPHDWDGQEDYLDGAEVAPSVSEAVTTLALDELALAPIAEHGVPRPGVRGACLWSDAVTGWQTWLLEADAGAVVSAPVPTSATDVATAPTGDEWFVLDGSVRFAAGDRVHELGRYGHRCDPDHYPAGGDAATADTPVRVLRWVRGGALTLA